MMEQMDIWKVAKELQFDLTIPTDCDDNQDDNDEDAVDELWTHYRSRTFDIVHGEKYLFGLCFLKGKWVKVNQDKIDKLEEDDDVMNVFHTMAE